MKAVYLETSAVLGWLFSEPGAELVLRAFASKIELLTSVLTFVEADRAIGRATREGLLTAQQEAKLKGVLAGAERSWIVMEISASVQIRARASFPKEPVRTMDAIHLATALEFAGVYDAVSVASFDSRITDNLKPLGLALWADRK